MHSDSLKSRTVKGLSWSLANSLIKQALTFLIMVYMARALGPKEFGIVGMITVFAGFVSIIAEQGFSVAIIQKQDIEERHLNSIYWLSVFIGALCTIFFALAAVPISKFYHLSVLRPVTVVISVNYLISSFSVVQNALFIKRIDFRTLTVIDTIAVVCSGCVGLILAVSGFGVWSLVWQSVVLTVVTAVATFFMSPWRPRLRFDFVAVKEMLGFSANILGFNAFNYWIRNFDNLLIGRYLGDYALGIYGRAYQLMLLPLRQVSWVVSRVMFPALSAIQNDLERVRRIYLQSIEGIALITFPLMVGLFTVSDSFVLAVFGEKWVGMTPVLKILCWIGMTQSVDTTVGWIYNSRGRFDLQFKWGVLSGVVYVISFIIGLRWGVMGIALAYAISGYFILWYPSWAIAGRLINVNFTDMLRSLSGPIYCSVIMGVFVWVSGLAVPSSCGPWMHLAVQVPAGAVAYLILIRVFRLASYGEVKKIIMLARDVSFKDAVLGDR